ncbi:MbnP family protein [Fulvivirga ligni]|uniref:MbnP family protein n=1 Tax=Fulvivirga ligni TaxID=2904246 RepID=UPI001F363F28|nr:MbnP family protein [Fulvivirga ligni]UII20932.1 hypothetical protein LVD16_24110 [Fulvivirga ligni]
MKTIKYLYILLLFPLFIACGDDDGGENNAASGEMVIEFDNRVAGTNLSLNTTDYPYMNSLDQSFKVTKLRYYISNFILHNADGTSFTMPLSEDGAEGYYLVDESQPASTEITLSDIPEGDYTGFTFTIGVDADRVKEGAQTGALDVTNNMFWGWNMGYIFMQFEGESPESTEDGQVLQYHMGGYKSDPDNPNLVDNIKMTTLSGEFTIASNLKPQAHIVVDVKKFFDSPNVIDFSSNASRHSPAAAAEIAENYVNAFVLDHIHAD